MEVLRKNKKVITIVFCALAVIILAVLMFFVFSRRDNENIMSGDGNNNYNVSKKDQVKIRESETKKVNFVEFNNGLVSLKIPQGWKVQVIGDYIHYTIRAFSEENPTYQFFFNMKTEGFNKSQDAKNFQIRYYPDQVFAKTSVIEEKTTEGFYKIFNDMGKLNNTSDFTFPTLTDFNTVEKIGNSIFGGDILRATFKDDNGKDAEGIFTAYVYDPGPYYVYENITYGKQIDIYFLNVYNTMFFTAPKDELVNWEETLNTIASSLQFSDTFVSQYYAQQDSVMKTFQSIRNVCNQITDGIMDSWEKRNASFDIMSQKQSDATLGYERVYDTENGDVYKTYNGFTDDYKGNRYQTITDDMYTKSISGYIEEVI